MALAVAFLTPILLFLLSLQIPGWRALVVSIPPVLLIALNSWRFIGLGFLMAYQEELLPGGFAWPAGLGDIAMAVTAPWIAARVASDDQFRLGKTFLMWNLFGIADFVDAVFLGTLYLWPGFSPAIDTALMQRLPFALIPCFFCAIGRSGAPHSLGAAASRTHLGARRLLGLAGGIGLRKAFSAVRKASRAGPQRRLCCPVALLRIAGLLWASAPPAVSH